MKIICTKEYYSTGELRVELYHKEGGYYWHRVDGPAHIEYYQSGQKSYEDYYQNDQHHRVDGPAQIWYSEDGEIIEASLWLHGKRINPTNLMKMLWKNKSK